MTNWDDAWSACNQEAAKAVGEATKAASGGQGLPAGRYVMRLVECTPDVYTDSETGDVHLNPRYDFEVVSSPSDPKLVGRRHCEFFRLGPSKNAPQDPETGQPISYDLGNLKKMYKDCFHETPPNNPKDVAERMGVEAIGSCWSVQRKQKGEYVNTYFNGIVNDA
jgi:hypothetical protein